jgi:hypothetical protein
MDVLEAYAASIFSSKLKPSKHGAGICVLFVGSLCGVLFYTEDEGNTCLRSISELPPDYVAPQLHYSS